MNNIKIEITIPQYYNDKTQIESYKFENIKNMLLIKYEGLTIIKDTIGYWKQYPEEKNDIIQIITELDNLDKDWLISFKHKIESYLKQESIFIVISECQIL